MFPFDSTSPRLIVPRGVLVMRDLIRPQENSILIVLIYAAGGFPLRTGERLQLYLLHVKFMCARYILSLF